MFREILPILAYMSVLSSTYSLHMARDAYIKAPPPPPAAAQLLEELDDMSELLAENSIPAGPPSLHSKVHHQSALLQQQQQQQQQQQLLAPQLHTIGGVAAGGPHGVVINHLTSNELPELSPPPVRHPVGPLIQPRGLQELFGVQTNFDMRNIHQQPLAPQLPPLQQQQQLKSSSAADDGANSDEDQQQQPRNSNNNNKRSSHNNNNGGTADGTGGFMDDGPSSSGGSSSTSNNNGGLPQIPHGMASQLMLRSARGQRQYDVPQIECPPAMDGMERFACPTPDRQGRYRCIDDHVLCDGFIDCPEGEDEDRQACMFYKTTKAHLDVLADALLRWARGR
ncbi:protein PIEZO homolog [Wyeomyia smithii]|uniref:protein PIEZO homolog n=1 Tax=Wyeomyia smithii TaxID=174621 RepID=UPI002467DC15|nr:protein PIEZO homolog [Wyeomyia smithii]